MDNGEQVYTLSLLSTVDLEKVRGLPSVVYLPASRRNQVYSVGKSSSCSLTIPCEHISRAHLTIRYEGKGSYSIKSNSKNGTVVNRRRIDGKGWVPLRQEDRVGLIVHRTRGKDCACAYTFLFATMHRRRVGMRIRLKPVLEVYQNSPLSHR